MYEANGNDATLLRNSVKGNVIYFKKDYGFIKPDSGDFDDLFFHVNDVEPGRESHVEFVGVVREKRMEDEDGNEFVTMFFPGERVQFDIKESGKMVTDKRTGIKKKGYKAVNIQIISTYEPKTLKIKE